MKKNINSLLALFLIFSMSIGVNAETITKIEPKTTYETMISPRGMVIPNYEVRLVFPWWEGRPSSYYYQTTINGKNFAGTLYLVEVIPNIVPDDPFLIGLYRGDLYQTY